MSDIKEIMQYVPHRYPFLLIDRILDFKKDESVIARKCVSMNEAQFQGHFPGEPVLPGVLITEHMAQAACFLLAKSAGGLEEGKVYYLGKVNKMVFKKPVTPGDVIETEVTILTAVGSMCIAKAVARVDGKMVAKGELSFAAA